MKKTVFILLAVILSLTVSAQKKTTELKEPIKSEVKQEQKAPVDTLVVDVSKVRFLNIGGQIHDLTTDIPLFVSFQWIINGYDFIDNAKSGLSKKETEALQTPLLPYWQYYQKQVQSQKK